MPCSGESETNNKKMVLFINLVVFFAFTAQLQRETFQCNVFIEDLNTRRQIFFYFKTLMCSIKIQRQEKSHMFDQFSQLK